MPGILQTGQDGQFWCSLLLPAFALLPGSSHPSPVLCACAFSFFILPPGQPFPTTLTLPHCLEVGVAGWWTCLLASIGPHTTTCLCVRGSHTFLPTCLPGTGLTHTTPTYQQQLPLTGHAWTYCLCITVSRPHHLQFYPTASHYPQHLTCHQTMPGVVFTWLLPAPTTPPHRVATQDLAYAPRTGPRAALPQYYGMYAGWTIVCCSWRHATQRHYLRLTCTTYHKQDITGCYRLDANLPQQLWLVVAGSSCLNGSPRTTEGGSACCYQPIPNWDLPPATCLPYHGPRLTVFACACPTPSVPS